MSNDLPANALITRRQRHVTFMLDDFLREPEAANIEQWLARAQIDDEVIGVCALLRVFLPDDPRAQEIVDYLITFADDFEDVLPPVGTRDFADFEIAEGIRLWRHKMRHIRFRGEFASIADDGTGPLGTDPGWGKHGKK